MISIEQFQPGPELYQELFELSPTPGALFKLDGRCILVNQAFVHQLGHERQALLAGEILFSDLFHRASSGQTLIDELQSREVIRRREVHIKNPAGRPVAALFSGRILKSDLQTLLEVSLTDISRQKALERAFRRDHAQLSALIESIAAGLFLVDNDGMIAEFNLSLANMLQLDQERLIGGSYEQVFAQFLEKTLEPEILQQDLSHAILGLDSRPVIEVVLNGDGPRYLEIAFFPVWDEDGDPLLGWGGLVQDVTELRDRLAWKLELLSILAHDIRTPLATLKGHATALIANYRNWSSEMVAEFLEVIDRSTDQLVRQVDRSLALTRVETGRLGLRPQAVDVAEIIQLAIERAAGALGERRIEINLEDECPQIRADPARVEEVLLNLLDNAARYSPAETSIHIEAHVDDSMLAISVRDHGPGIPAEQQDRIFEKYSRADESRPGSGLGLFINRKIIEAHGGRIWLESHPSSDRTSTSDRAESADASQGTRFIFTLPIMPDVRQASSTEKRQKADKDRQRAQSEGRRVLVVEDEADFQALLRAVLVEEGYEVDIVPNGPAALDVLHSSPPELVLLDWNLPEMDGLNVCRNIRRWSSVPILLVTARISQTDLVAALDAGADDYLTKPFQRPELLARMRALLRRSGVWTKDEPDRFNAAGLTIDFSAREVWVRGKRVSLTPTEFDLLAYLSRNQGQVLTYDQLGDHLWELDENHSRHDLFVHVSRLRKKIEPDEEPRFIVTRWGMGYVFLPE